MISEAVVIANAIKQKGYTDIPEWMMKRIDTEVLTVLIDNILSQDIILKYDTTTKSKYLHPIYNMNVLSFFKLVSERIGNLVPFLKSTYVWKFAGGVALVPVAMAKTDKEMNVILKRYGSYFNHSKHCGHAMAVYYKLYGHVSKPLLKFFLHYIVMGDNKCRAFDTITRSMVSLELSEKYLVDTIDALKRISKNYIWSDIYFSDDVIWSHGVPYFSSNVTVENISIYIDYMSQQSILDRARHYGMSLIPDEALGILTELTNDNDYDEDQKVGIYENIVRMSMYDVNYIRFLAPFKSVLSLYDTYYRTYHDILYHHLFATNGSKLTNYDYIDDVGGVKHNDEIQMEYIKGNGDVTSLLSDKMSAIYTTSGVEVALSYFDDENISKMLTNRRIHAILTNTIIGIKPYFPIIDKLVDGIVYNGNYDNHYIKDLIRLINIKYSLLNIVRDNGVLSCCEILHTSKSRVYNVVKQYPNAITRIPFGQLSHQQILHIVKHEKTYVPLNTKSFGIDACMDVETLAKLITADTPAYLCDITSERVGQTMLMKLRLEL